MQRDRCARPPAAWRPRAGPSRWPAHLHVTSDLRATSSFLPGTWRNSLDEEEKSTSPWASWACSELEGTTYRAPYLPRAVRGERPEKKPSSL